MVNLPSIDFGLGETIDMLRERRRRDEVDRAVPGRHGDEARTDRRHRALAREAFPHPGRECGVGRLERARIGRHGSGCRRVALDRRAAWVVLAVDRRLWLTFT